jgi:hypothetical protein
MLRRAVFGGCFVACLAVAITGLAQEGHPLSGTWSGDWGPTAAERHPVTLVMTWDGKNVTGILDPGPNSTQIGSVFLDPASWTVRFEANAKDSSGNPVPIAAEGRLEDIASYHRSIRGKWRQGAADGDFRITRD